MIAPVIVAAGISALSSLLGGSGGTTQKNVNNSLLTSNLSGTLGKADDSSDAIARLLGIGGSSKDQEDAFNTFKGSTGYQFGLDQGSQAITGNRAASGLLNSGGTLKALTQFGQDYGSSKFQDYLTNLFNEANLGLGAGGILAQSGVKSKTKSGKK